MEPSPPAPEPPADPAPPTVSGPTAAPTPPPPPVAPAVPASPPGWFADPASTHEYRYWDGKGWTDHVADAGQRAIDALTRPAPPPGDAPPPSPSATASAPARPLAPSPVATTASWRRTGGLAKALTVLSWCTVVASLVMLGALVNRIGVASDILDREVVGADRANRSDDYVQAAGGLVLVLLLALAVCTIIWMWRTAKNNEALGRTGPRFGPGWSIGAWFIPLANLVIPVLIVQDFWRATEPGTGYGDAAWRTRKGSRIVGWWWALWVVSALTRLQFASDDEARTFSELRDVRSNDTTMAVGAVVAIGAAVLFIQVVRRITARQEALSKEIWPAGS